MHTGKDIIVTLGLGGPRRGSMTFSPRGVARKIIVEGALVDGDGSGAGKKPHPRDRGLPAASVAPNVIFFLSLP